MEQYVLYVLIKNIIKDLTDNKYSVSFNDMDFNKPESIGIYIKGGEVPKYRNLSTGNYFNFIHRVQIVLQGNNTNEGLFGVLDAATKIRNYMVVQNNTLHTVNDPKLGEDDIDIQIGLVKLLGETNFNNKTSQGLPVYSINFKIQYYVRR